jgi:hypothetical protein
MLMESKTKAKNIVYDLTVKFVQNTEFSKPLSNEIWKVDWCILAEISLMPEMNLIFLGLRF